MQIEEIKALSDRAMVIVWDDGHEGLYFADHLRKNCPCASCKGEDDPIVPKGLFKIMNNPASVEDVKIDSWDLMGRYAVSFRFSDGHHTGIYPYALLRDLCQCDLCSDNAVRIEGPFKP